MSTESAKELTREIDQATDEVLRAPIVESLATRAAELAGTTEAADVQALGSVALEGATVESNVTIKEGVARENGYVDMGRDDAINVIGGESEKQIKERLADDRSDLETEDGIGADLRGHRLLVANQERLTGDAVATIDRAIRAKATRPAELESIRHVGMIEMLKGYGRIFGERN